MKNRSLFLLLLPLLWACNGTLYSATGSIMSGYAVEHMFPYMLQTNDLDLACGSSLGLGAMSLSFERVTAAPDKTAIMVLSTTAICAQRDAWFYELKQIEAERKGQSDVAQDALIQEKRLRKTAAQRYHQAYLRTEKAFALDKNACPKLKTQHDKTLVLLGLFSGILAVIHDRASDGESNVPLDIPRRVAALSDCLDSPSLYFVPQALKAGVWTSVPGTLPSNVDAFKLLAKASEEGDKTGLRFARAIEVEALYGAGRVNEAKQAIRDYAKNIEKYPSLASMLMLDTVAFEIIRHVADRYSMKEKGHRTASGMLGHAEGKTKSAPDNDNLLDGLK